MLHCHNSAAEHSASMLWLWRARYPRKGLIGCSVDSATAGCASIQISTEAKRSPMKRVFSRVSSRKACTMQRSEPLAGQRKSEVCVPSPTVYKLLNLTQHVATPDQAAAGVIEPADKVLVQALITFDELPDQIRLKAYAQTLAQMARDGFDSVMIGGAPFFMPVLQAALQEREIKVLYAFSVRESRDEKLPDGSVKKTQVFRHAGFVEAT